MFIPLHDANSLKYIKLQYVTFGLIGLNVLVFLITGFGSEEFTGAAVYGLGYIPSVAFDTVEQRPVVRDNAIAIRHMVYLSMSWDHRMIDGATASKFLARIKQDLESWDFTPEVQAYL